MTSRRSTRTRYGLLTLGPRTTRRDSQGELLYRCSCACGGTTLSSLRQLRRGKKKSCGCLRSGHTGTIVIHDQQVWPLAGTAVPVTMMAAVLQRRPDDLQQYLLDCSHRRIPVEQAVRAMIR
jgi:hypothetical protein